MAILVLDEARGELETWTLGPSDSDGSDMADSRCFVEDNCTR